MSDSFVLLEFDEPYTIVNELLIDFKFAPDQFEVFC